MDEWNEEGFFYPTLMVAYEIADYQEDFVPIIVYENHPGIFLQLKFTRKHRTNSGFKLPKANPEKEEGEEKDKEKKEGDKEKSETEKDKKPTEENKSEKSADKQSQEGEPEKESDSSQTSS